MTREEYLSMRLNDSIGLLYTVYLEELKADQIQYDKMSFTEAMMIYPFANVSLSILYDKYDTKFNVICVYDKSGNLIKAE
jgi:hypothetical protein